MRANASSHKSVSHICHVHQVGYQCVQSPSWAMYQVCSWLKHVSKLLAVGWVVWAHILQFNAPFTQTGALQFLWYLTTIAWRCLSWTQTKFVAQVCYVLTKQCVLFKSAAGAPKKMCLSTFYSMAPDLHSLFSRPESLSDYHIMIVAQSKSSLSAHRYYSNIMCRYIGRLRRGVDSIKSGTAQLETDSFCAILESLQYFSK